MVLSASLGHFLAHKKLCNIAVQMNLGIRNIIAVGAFGGDVLFTECAMVTTYLKIRTTSFAHSFGHDDLQYLYFYS